MKKLVIPILLCAGYAALAQADNASTTSTAATPPPDRFNQLDTDGDGKISAAEFAAARPNNSKNDTAAMFKRLDKDGDGVVSTAELHAGRMDRSLPTDANAIGGRPNHPVDGAAGTHAEHPGGGMNHPGMGGPGAGGPAGMGGPGGMHGPMSGGSVGGGAGPRH